MIVDDTLPIHEGRRHKASIIVPLNIMWTQFRSFLLCRKLAMIDLLRFQSTTLTKSFGQAFLPSGPIGLSCVEMGIASANN